MGHARPRLTVIAGAALLSAAAAAHAQGGVQSSATASGTMTVLDPVAISESAEFAQGAVARPKAGAGSVDVPGATYTVSGLGGQSFNVTTPASIKLSRVGGADQIQLTLTPSQTTGLVPGPASRPGAATIGVGGTAPVTGATSNGLYVGEYGLTVAYP
jgi:hypothetical protein